MSTPLYSSERETDDYLLVNNCGERFLNLQDERTVRENGRVDFGVQFVERGRAYYVEDGKTYAVEAGAVLLHFPRVPQRYFFKKSDDTHLMWVHFTGSTALSLLQPLASDKTVVVRLQQPAKFARTLSRMITAYTMRSPHFNVACAGYLLVLISMLLSSAEQSAPTEQAQEGLLRVYNHMHLHFADPIDLDAYAAMCFVSRDRFLHLFKAHSGVSPYRFQLQLRIDRAAEMLNYTEASIAQTAAAVGFKDPAYFCRLFKKYTGLTPSAYRKRG